MVVSFVNFCRETSFKLIDKGLLELFGPYAILATFSSLAKKVAGLTSGYIFHYSFLLIFGVSLLLFFNFFVLESVSFELFFIQMFFIFAFILNFNASAGE